MQAYPLTMSFKLMALRPEVNVTDGAGTLVLYVKQKALALKEDVKIFADEQQQRQLYQMNANRIIDFSAQYAITRPGGALVGTVRRRGRRSIWRATYDVLDSAGTEVGRIYEENPWIRLIDAVLGGFIPFVGYFINPAYLVDLRGNTVLRMKKERAVFERRFTVGKRAEFTDADEDLLLPGLIMAMLLERGRG